MNTDIRQLLEGVSTGSVSVEEAILALKRKPFEDIGYAKVDMHRKIRQGAAEVIYGLTPELVAESCLPHCKLDVYMAYKAFYEA